MKQQAINSNQTLNYTGLLWRGKSGLVSAEYLSDLDIAESVIQSTDGNYIIAGYTFSSDGDIANPNGSYDAWLIKLNSAGNLIWEKSVGGNSYNVANSLIEVGADEFILAGTSSYDSILATDNNGSYDYWVVKLSLLISVNEIQKSGIDFKVSPNPFSNESTITFYLPSNIESNVVIHDIEGRLVKNLDSKSLNRGTNELIWDGSTNSGNKVGNGIYFVTIVSDKFCESKRIEVLKN